MQHQPLTVFGAIAALVGLSVVPAVVVGQAPSASTPAAASDTLRTPWGEPNLQGIWTSETTTPLERPGRFAGREFLTDEEMAALDEERLERARSNPGRDRRATPGSEQDVAGAYNALWNRQPGDPGAERTGRRTSQIIDPPDGKLPAITIAARQRFVAEREYLQALLQGTSGGRPGPPSPRRTEPPPAYNLERMNRADGPEDRSAGERCLGSTLPAAGFFRIVQSAGYVAIYHDIGQGNGFSRLIPITDRPAPPSHIRFYHGDARGRWQGDTLVVEVSNFTQKTDFRGARENLHLVERYRRADANTLVRQITVTDPTTWTRPWTYEQPFAKQGERANLVFETSCHEGNFGMIGMLANTRAAETLFAEGRGPDPATMDIATGGGGGGPRVGQPID